MLSQVGRAFRSSKQSVYSAVFECSCGRRKVMIVGRVRSGKAKSCGLCRYRTGRGKTKSRAQIAWSNMRQRCLNPRNPDYPKYGGRGISVCPEWTSFRGFLADMGEPGPGLSLDRIDNDRGYGPDNCRWATKTDQLRNRRNNVLVEFEGETLTLAAVADRVGRRRITTKYQGLTVIVRAE